MYSVTTMGLDGTRNKHAFYKQFNKKMTLQNVASYAAAIVKNAAFYKDGKVCFAFCNDPELDRLTVYRNGIDIVRVWPSGNIRILDADIYAFDARACNYIKVALERARDEAIRECTEA